MTKREPLGGVASAGPGSAHGLGFRQAALAWGVFIVLAALAWVATIRQASGMGIEAGTMGMVLPLFLVMLVLMMAAMMFPSVAPVSIRWVRAIARRADAGSRGLRMALFVSGYLIAWASYGLLAFVALMAMERVVGSSPGVGRWVGTGLFLFAGLYQLTPLKNACLRHCRSPLMQLLQYTSWKGRARDLRVGLHHGAYCVGCCSGLMVVLLAMGVMNLMAMVGLTAVIFLEKLWRHGKLLSIVVGIAFLAIAGVVAFYPSLLPALEPGDMSGEMGGMTSGSARSG
jgi:predicted metal-binding membrane protein